MSNFHTEMAMINHHTRQSRRPAPGDLHGTPYPATYQRELSPAWLRYAAAVNGYHCRPLDRAFRYLELGCGEGISTLMHAAAFPHAIFHACDFDRGAILRARRRARALGLANVTFHAMSFADLLVRTVLEPFDFIAVHGVYSWVDEAARSDVRRLLERLLAPRGLACISYNCMPGWATEIPLRRMLSELAATCAGDPARRAGGAARLLQRLGDSGAAYFQRLPEAAQAVTSYLASPPGYLAHEYLSPAFEAFYSVDVADHMADIGLALIGSATLADNHVPLLVNDAAARAIASLPTPRQRQLAMDFAVHRRFRRDLFLRPGGAGDDDTPASSADVAAGPLPVGCPGEPRKLTATVTVPRGRLSFEPSFVDAVRTQVAAGPVPLRDLVAAVSPDPGRRAATLRNLLYLVAAGQLTPCTSQTAAGPGRR